MREVEIRRLVRNSRQEQCLLFLKEKAGNRIFPIHIHRNEMAEIHRKVLGEPVRRPMTHDLVASIVRAAALTLDSVQVTKLEHSIFYAQMNFEDHEGRSFTVDARPSDAVAVATGMGVPIFVDARLLDELGQPDVDEEAGTGE